MKLSANKLTHTHTITRTTASIYLNICYNIHICICAYTHACYVGIHVCICIYVCVYISSPEDMFIDLREKETEKHQCERNINWLPPVTA